LGPPWIPVLPEGSTCLLGEAEVRREGRALLGCFDDVMGARVRRKLPPEAHISPKTFPQGSGGMEVGSRLRATDTPSAPLACRFYRGPYDGVFGKCARCRILPSVGYPGILIPDGSPRACGGVVNSSRGLRTSDRGALLLFHYIFISSGRVLSGGCTGAHPPGVAPEALEGCGTPSRALIE
jgi:hypothetical protein